MTFNKRFYVAIENWEVEPGPGCAPGSRCQWPSLADRTAAPSSLAEDGPGLDSLSAAGSQ